MTEDTKPSAPPPAAAVAEDEPGSLRMVLTMGGIGLFCGILIVL